MLDLEDMKRYVEKANRYKQKRGWLK